MDKAYETKCHRIEEDYWWFAGRRDIITRIVGAFDKSSRILDVGCSGGALLKDLKACGYDDLYGVDISEKAIGLCRERNEGLSFVMDGARLGFGNDKFDVVIISDVLEHIREDSRALAEWNRVLKTGGRLIVFVPAFGFLWSEHDEVNHHCRRYSRPGLTRLLKEANFRVCRGSYWNFSLFFPTSVVRIFQRLFFSKKRDKKDQFYSVNPGVNTFLTRLLKIENGISITTGFPFGVSVFAVAVKER
ncbi:MAG: methyltransferase domain-containing protein [Candidatus Omnitrophica bacterium]|nr:methyltransferase domain-containing protein [Candidatus Omnitrophota bacterium]MBU0880933.1 methyltransferase domain-containing protein [Candidatus Omnitrophota bacterium]MBU1808063.1 methyltransferase domain-containing protein [Candidatus Omnitrophota bacterium]